MSLVIMHKKSAKECYHWYRMSTMAALQKSLKKFHGDPDICSELEEVLTPIVIYDMQHDSDLVKTLISFLKNGSSIAATADILFLHRNSVLYRLNRIEEIGGFDIKSKKVQETLKVALTFANKSLLDKLTNK